MDLNSFLSKPDSMSVKQLAAAIGVPGTAQVRQWQHRYGNRRPDPAYCVAIERVTGGEVTRQDLRPDDYWLIWPDLTAPTEKVA